MAFWSALWGKAPLENRPLVEDFGDAEDVELDSFGDYLGVLMNDAYECYTPPVNKVGLVKLLKANAYHGWMPEYRTRQVLRFTELSPVIKRDQLEMLLKDFLVTGELYALKVLNPLGRVIGIEHLSSVYMRKRPASSTKPRYLYLAPTGETQNFQAEQIIHIKQHDLLQKIYGIPFYFDAIHSVLLNEAATLFRRKYYRNGAHVGSIFVTTSESLKPKDEKAIAQKIKQSKGIGNFRSMYLHMPGKQKADDVVRVIPVGDVATRDEFERIKKLSQADIMAAWGTRPEVAGIMPENYGGTGNTPDLMRLDYDSGTLPLIEKIVTALNEHLAPRQHLEAKALVLTT